MTWLKAKLHMCILQTLVTHYWWITWTYNLQAQGITICKGDEQLVSHVPDIFQHLHAVAVYILASLDHGPSILSDENVSRSLLKLQNFSTSSSKDFVIWIFGCVNNYWTLVNTLKYTEFFHKFTKCYRIAGIYCEKYLWI